MDVTRRGRVGVRRGFLIAYSGLPASLVSQRRQRGAGETAKDNLPMTEEINLHRHFEFAAVVEVAAAENSGRLFIRLLGGEASYPRQPAALGVWQRVLSHRMKTMTSSPP